MQPSAITTEGKRMRWPVNDGNAVAELTAWAYIFAVEDGWCDYDRSGFLQWSELGRARYEAGDASTYADADGQGAFCF